MKKEKKQLLGFLECQNFKCPPQKKLSIILLIIPGVILVPIAFLLAPGYYLGWVTLTPLAQAGLHAAVLAISWMSDWWPIAEMTHRDSQRDVSRSCRVGIPGKIFKEANWTGRYASFPLILPPSCCVEHRYDGWCCSKHTAMMKIEASAKDGEAGREKES